MLVVTANWGFTDGTLVATAGNAGTARAWLRRVRRAAIRAGFGRDGTYRPPDGLDIVLAGDTFDGLVSAAWCGRDRPWRAGARAGDARRQVLLGCARRAAPLLAGLVGFARRGLDAPAADRRGRPSLATAVRVPVRVALLVGDRDRHLADVTADVAVRGAVVAPAWCDGTTIVRHGHEHDPACHADEATPGVDRPPTLAESVAVDLVARFAADLDAAGISRGVSAPLVGALAGASLAEVPPVVAGWIAAEGRDAGGERALRQEVGARWQRALAAWERAARRDPPDCGLPASPVEALAAWFAGPGNAPSRALAHLLDRHAAAIPAPPGATVVVVGHAERPGVDGTTICLGRPAVRRWHPTVIVRADGAAAATCVDAVASAAEPATILCRTVAEAPEWRWITGFRGPGSEAVHRSAAIVDAA